MQETTFIETLQESIAALRKELLAHPLYNKLESLEDLQLFTSRHVFAVWDFMSLLKALQRELTCVSSPWKPTASPASRRFINEIVLGEESDEDQYGQPISHFELYLKASEELGSDLSLLKRWLTDIESLKPGNSVLQLIEEADYLPKSIAEFMRFNFHSIEEQPLHVVASVFCFGREDLIPDMFRRFVEDLATKQQSSFETFIYYLDRHIEVDGDHHGPLALRLMEELCGQDAQKWQEATRAAQEALQKRQVLWQGILEEMQTGVF